MAKQPLIETADLNIKLEAATEEINLFLKTMRKRNTR